LIMDSIGASYQGAKVVVTGGLGFIGSSLARRLVEAGADVLVVDPMLPNTGANCANLKGLEGKLRLHIFDPGKPNQITSLLPGHDFIFNLAGKVSHLDSMRDPLSDLEANVRAQVLLLEACRQYAPLAKIVYASTRQVYGRPVSCPVDESHPVRPVDVNGVNKAAGESYHTLYHQVYGLRTVCLRLTNTFGPRMRVKDARQTFLGIWLRHVVEDGAFEIWGGQQKRDFTYVDDVVDAFLAVAVCPDVEGRTFNIGGGPPVTLAELAETLIAIAGTGRFEIRQFPPERLRIDIGDYFADDRVFRRVTGWAPKITLQEGLTRTVAYYRENLTDYV
jgi:UDP-glucose 4-epimerase